MALRTERTCDECGAPAKSQISGMSLDADTCEASACVAARCGKFVEEAKHRELVVAEQLVEAAKAKAAEVAKP